MLKEKKIKLNPEIPKKQKEAFIDFCRLAMEAEKKSYTAYHELKKEYLIDVSSVKNNAELMLAFSISLVLDLLLQDWRLSFEEDIPVISLEEKDTTVDKEQTRRRHLLKRNSQLNINSVRSFISKMESTKLFNNRFHSIYSLMRDGEELAEKLTKLASMNASDSNALSKIIDPYIQIVEPKLRCEKTGLFLADVWRYFRHTWINDYQSVPGRSIQVLIRDRASDNHPVIGIAALGSAIAQQTLRDKFINWEPGQFVEQLIENPTARYSQWIHNGLKKLINEVFKADFYEENIITEKTLLEPSQNLIEQLKSVSAAAKEKHVLNPNEAKISKPERVECWEEVARLPLYRSKRALLLAELLKIRACFLEHNFKGNIEALKKALKKAKFRDAVRMYIRRAKYEKIGVDIMDIMVCGSVAPYNHILGGKLVCFLLTSPELIDYYNKRYSNQISIIASGMNGEKIIRKPQLSYLSTTSLYGVGSSQYNRVKIPIEKIEANRQGALEYKKLGISEGYGLFHISKETEKLASTALSRNDKSFQRINSIFGEGANPKMRALNAALSLLDIDANIALKHSNKRVVYGIPLINNLNDYLLGVDKKPEYKITISGNKKEKTKKIVEYWYDRWLSKRIHRDDVLDRVEKEKKTYPMIHNARVYCPDPEEPDLFNS